MNDEEFENKPKFSFSFKTALIVYSIIVTVLLGFVSFKYYELKKNPNLIYPSQINAYDDCGKPVTDYDVLFFYSPIDKYSKNMIAKIKSSNLKFYWINVYDPKCKGMKSATYGYTGWIPYFYCLHNGLNYTGEMNNSTWNWFVSNCGG